MSNRLNKDREQKLQPVRREYAIQQLFDIGINDIYRDETKIQFEYKGEKITLYFYSGWHTGKSITDGRGLANLIKQLI